MRKIVTFIIVLCMSTTIVACGNNTQKNNSNEVVNKERVEVDSSKLNSASFWIDKIKNSEEVVMTEDEITTLNKNMMDKWGMDWYEGYYDVSNITENVDINQLKERICYLDLRNSELYRKGELVDEAGWDNYYSNLNLDGITEELRYAIIIRNTSALDMPTYDILTDSSLDEAFNSLQQTTLKMNEPVVVLHESSDEKWLYVVANEYIGWVEKDNCAYFSNKQAWIDYMSQEDFLMICADTTIEALDRELLMGTKIFISNTEVVEGKDYVLQIPEKNDEGFVTFSYIGILKNEAFNEGYLPYTRKNVIELAFSELGEPYGWGGANGERDCSLYIKDIYECFGIEMPRNSRLQMNMVNVSENMSEMSEKDKEERITKAMPGDILGISGHVMLYLGEVNGKHYVISMLSSYVPETVTDNFSESVEDISKVFVNSLDVRRRNGNTWLQELIAIVNIQ
ncbi:MAG: SH3 domain-containing protein [Lachnospiraceae bacterium]|nr:SH3 domain-containing protein [Lachnospiraceae bacterium]